MKISQIATICSGQGGAIWGRLLFRFKNNGECYVYDLERQSNAAADAPAVEVGGFVWINLIFSRLTAMR